MNPRLENWHVRGAQDSYTPPELQRLTVGGQVFDSLKFTDGERIKTSFIVAISGREIKTHSGSVYTLGRPDNAYVTWCQENGCHVPTPDEPIKLR